MRFGSDIIVIYYLCLVEKLIYSKCYSITAVLNELCIPDFDPVACKLQQARCVSSG